MTYLMALIHELLSDSSRHTKFHTLSLVNIWNPGHDPSGHPGTPLSENEAGTTPVTSSRSTNPLFFVVFWLFLGDDWMNPLMNWYPAGDPDGESYDELSVPPGDDAMLECLDCFIVIGCDVGVSVLVFCCCCCCVSSLWYEYVYVIVLLVVLVVLMAVLVVDEKELDDDDVEDAEDMDDDDDDCCCWNCNWDCCGVKNSSFRVKSSESF